MTEPSPENSTPEPAPEVNRHAELEAEVNRLKDALLRSQADQQNQQRRHRDQQNDLRKFATAGLIEELLPTLDVLALGLEAANGKAEAKAVVDGFRMAVQQFRGVLNANGLTELLPTGKVFDAKLGHESVAQESSDTVPEGSIIKVVRAGWLLHDRILRTASVIVSTGPANK
jgi:molecular chaperone GrpE